MRNPKNLTFWPQVVEFVIRIYRFASSLPRDEQYNLASQTKRAAVYVRRNIVNGAASENAAECARYFENAYRCLREALACLELSVELDLCKEERIHDLLEFGDKLAGAMYGYRKSLF